MAGLSSWLSSFICMPVRQTLNPTTLSRYASILVYFKEQWGSESIISVAAISLFSLRTRVRIIHGPIIHLYSSSTQVYNYDRKKNVEIRNIKVYKIINHFKVIFKQWLALLTFIILPMPQGRQGETFDYYRIGELISTPNHSSNHSHHRRQLHVHTGAWNWHWR